MVNQAVDDRLAGAVAALDKHEWDAAYEALLALDRDGKLNAAGLELLGEAGWWVHQPDVSVAARERAYAAYISEGDRVRAGYMALLASRDHANYQADVVAMGWWARATRVLKDEPESFAHGYLALFEGMQALANADLEAARTLGERALELGTRFGENDLQGFGLVLGGAALVRLGEVERGLLLLDEATAAAVGGEFSPFATGLIYCYTIGTCRDLADYRRAGQWTQVAERWCERQSINGFPGVCRVHRAEIMALRGDWTDAETELQRASAELLTYKSAFQAAEGYYQLGEIRLRMGDLAGADEAFREAQDLGREPQPGRALLQLAHGRLDAAMTSIERHLLMVGPERLTRVKSLPSQVEIALAAGNVAVARRAADELSAIASDFGSMAIQAAARFATGTVSIAEQEPERAIDDLNQARSLWRTVDVPYELARTRLALALALRAQGEVDEATVEAEAARTVFTRLGAATDAARCQQFLGELQQRVEQGVRERRTFMFTDIVGSTELLNVIGDSAWNDLKRWHDQTLRSVASQHGGEEINEAGDGFFFAFQSVVAAVDCAVAMQRALADHRRTAGFAPRIRIGLHAAEATRVGQSYVGQGVHEAARIGSAAGTSEIAASVDTLAGETIRGLGSPREVSLKGIAGPVWIQTIDWAPVEG